MPRSISRTPPTSVATQARPQAAASSSDVGIPADLKAIVNPADLDFLAESAYADACRPGNPRDTSVEEIKELYLKLM